MAGLEVSAPGKVILFGEHSVVYGQPALASATDRRTKLCLTLLEVCCRVGGGGGGGSGGGGGGCLADSFH